MASTLGRLEGKIEQNIKKAWYENGLCLLEIQQRGLYKKKYDTFEKYIEARWDYGLRRSQQMIEAARKFQVIEHKSASENVNGNAISVHIPLPKNEWQIRPLVPLEDAEACYIWEQVVEQHEKPTQAKVQAAVDAFKDNPVSVPPIEVAEVKLTSSSGGVLYNPGTNDECYTPDYAVKALLPHLEKFKGKTIWCPFDTEESQFVTVLRDAGHVVIHSHISAGQDYYTHEPLDWDLMVSNPPFTDKRKIFERAISFCKPFALIMSNTWLNDAAPKQIFKGVNFQLLMFEERMKFLNQDNSENKITFSSSYFCSGVLDETITMDSLKNYGY